MRVRSTTAFALACAFAAPAQAADDSAAGEAQDPGVIIVTGQRDQYGLEATSTATRTPTELNDIPQAISVVTEAQVDDQAMRSIADVLRYVPGANSGQGEGHRDQIVLRGNNSTADFFTDGLRDDVQYYRGLYNVERVEVLKGPNAMIFGRGGGGGIVNRVTKTPAADAFMRGSAGLDSEGGFVIDADLNQPFGTSAAARLNAVYERFDTHREVYEGERFAINPTLAVTLGDRTRIDLSYEYDKDNRVVDRGVPSFAGRPLAGFRDTFFGDPDVNDADFDAHILKARLQHRFSDRLSLTSRLLYGDYDKLYQNVFPATAVTADPATGRLLFGIEAYRDGTQRRNLLSQTDLVWNLRTGGVGHVILAGFEYADQDSGSQRTNGFFASGNPQSPLVTRIIIPLTDPVATPPIAAWTIARSSEGRATAHALYVQDQLSLGDHFDVVAGIRYDRFKLEVDNLLNGDEFSREDDLWSPRLGLVAKPIAPLSIYASYSRSYLPQSGDQFASLDLTTEALKPERFDNYELGLKWDIRPALSLTAAIYRLDRTNTRAVDPGSGDIVLTGAQRSEGLEIGLTGSITKRWQVSGGYTLQSAEVRRATTACDPAARDCAVPLVPRHQIALWNRYDVSSRIGLGLGLYHQSKSYASISNEVALPAFTRIDAAAYFAITDQVEAQVNVENLLGEDYFATAHNDNNISPGAPIRATATLRFGF
ncbi:MAG TPA: TonB-dependent siderophore receptor [Allosphingosinicella sp.]|nr:TonB-dependent siderophore receptor [Allosphingosinicella sp.]